jgi:two-component system, NtrC family, sensor kinase
VFLALGLVSTACMWALVDIHNRLHAVKTEEEKARGILRLAGAVRDQYAHVAHTIIIGNDSHAGFFEESSRSLRDFAMRAKARDGAAETSTTVSGILRDSDEIERLFRDQVLPAVRSEKTAPLAEVHERILEHAMHAQSAAEALAGAAEASMDDLGKHVAATQHSAILLTLVAHVLALVTAGVVGVYLHRSVARPIKTLSSAVERVGSGDLDTAIPIEREDEVGVLARRFNEMTTSLKDHQARLLRTEKLAGLGRMAAGIAHELNNPIAVILGYAKLLQRRKDAMADAQTLKAIEDEAERAHQVIEGLLQLTRDGVVNARPVSMRPVVDAVAERIRISSGAAATSLEIVGEVQARADEPMLRQILTNLICNALEASPREQPVVVALEREGKWAAVTVSDNGPGVKPADRDRIFEPFFTTKPSGTGLGLAISRAIARAHGGDLTLVPSANGASFRLTLPAVEGVPS